MNEATRIIVGSNIATNDLAELYRSVGWSSYTDDLEALHRAIQNLSYVVQRMETPNADRFGSRRLRRRIHFLPARYFGASNASTLWHWQIAAAKLPRAARARHAKSAVDRC